MDISDKMNALGALFVYCQNMLYNSTSNKTILARYYFHNCPQIPESSLVVILVNNCNVSNRHFTLFTSLTRYMMMLSES